tara:strand:+ start:1068 stop:1292 length:225 start_codon:yes stop_codon:yes gene_type:complete
MKTTEITFEIPLEASSVYRKDQCAEHIAQLLDQSFGTSIEDLGSIHDFIQDQINQSELREVEFNRLNDINGGSK